MTTSEATIPPVAGGSRGEPAARSWMAGWLVAAGAYNLVWGAAVVLFPAVWFTALGMEPPRYPGLWQCVGMIVGVYGIGYLIAASNPVRHWPIVLVGLLGKILGPIGFLGAAWRGELPWTFGWTILTNDLLWWPAFSAILWTAFRESSLHPRSAHRLGPDGPRQTPAEAMGEAILSDGSALLDRSNRGPVLVVFLRHFGCTFCRAMLADLRDRERAIRDCGIEPVVVHMIEPEPARAELRRLGLPTVLDASDPTQRLHRAFRLPRGRFDQLFGPRVWVRGLVAALRGHGLGVMSGDGLQLSGGFLVRDGRVVVADRHASAGDRLDLDRLCSMCPDGPVAVT